MVGETDAVAAAEQLPAGRAYRQIVDAVERDLYAGVLQPGDRLPSEREMVARYGVSRASVREALRVLENSGLVRSRHGDRAGPLVLDPAGGPLADTMTRIAKLHGCTPGELVGFRMVLESAANQLAAYLRTEDQLTEIRGSLAAMRAAVDEGGEAFGRADFAFHECIVRASRNTLLEYNLKAARQAVLAQIGDKIAQAGDARAQLEESLRHHELVFAAIESGDGELAAALAKQSLLAYYGDALAVDERLALAKLCGPGENPFVNS
ncbi:MAG: FCD domain-containing protein [Streptosporangiales bacterium]|nr:FCD domain-containing protein [Streptosporangiales bacterium]